MISFDFLRNLPVKRKLTFIVLATCGVILLLACAGLFAFQLVLFKKTFARDLTVLARVIADNSTGAVSFGDKRAAEEIVSSLTAQPHIVSARIELANGLVLAAAGPADARKGGARSSHEGARYESGDLLLSERITLKNEVLGTLYLRANPHTMHRDLMLLFAGILVVVLGGASGIAVLLSARLQRFITEPILELAETARVVAERRDYSVRAEKLSGDEFGLFTDTFNQMLGRIESQDSALRTSELQFRQLAENIREVFWMTTPDLKEIIYVSPAYEEIWGRSVESLTQNPLQWIEAVVPEERQRVFATFLELGTHGPAREAEYRILRPDGTIRWIHARGCQVLDKCRQVYRLVGTASDITERKRAEVELEQTHKQLRDTSRQAGMAEVATNVLHNVGNVLNSVNVSATLVTDQVRKSKAANLSRVSDLMREHAADLDTFIMSDPRGKQLPAYISQLAEHLAKERRTLLEEVELLKKNIEHIKDIVAMQQSYAKVSGVSETVKVTDLVEDALRMNAGALVRHEVQLFREYDPHAPEITTEKHKVLQILVNLIRNAKYACDESGRKDKCLTVRVTNGNERVRIAIADNGVGIPAENLSRIFNHGFTTRKNGHGFGLHSGALAARELGGALLAHSDGPGLGATFTLELPLQQPTTARD